MANSPSARKRIRQTIKRTERNVARRSRARRYVRIFEEALNENTNQNTAKENTAKENEKNKAKTATSASETLPLAENFRRAMSELHRAAQKGALHRKAVSRKVSRLARRLLRQQSGAPQTQVAGKVARVAKESQKAKRAKAAQNIKRK